MYLNLISICGLQVLDKNRLSECNPQKITKKSIQTHSQNSIKKKKINQTLDSAGQGYTQDIFKRRWFSLFLSSLQCKSSSSTILQVMQASGYVTGVRHQVSAAQLLTLYSIITEVRYSAQADGGPNQPPRTAVKLAWK